MFCRLPDEFDRNSVDVRIHTHHRNKLEKSMSSEHRYSHEQAGWFKPWGTTYLKLQLASMNPHETTTISPRVQGQFIFGTIYDVDQELSNK